MKLSYRDKVIFVCVIVVLILVAGVFLFIKPKFEEMNYAKIALEAKQVEKDDLQAKIDTFPQLVETLKNTAGEVEELQSYFLTEQDPYLNEQFIHEILDKNNVEVTGMETAYTVAGNLQEYVVVPSNVAAFDLLVSGDLYNELPQEVYDVYNNTVVEKGDSVFIGVTDMTIGYKDNYDLSKVMKFVDEIANYGKTMNIVSVTKDKANGENNQKDGSLALRLYSIYPLNVEKVMEEADEIQLVPVEETAADETVTEAAE